MHIQGMSRGVHQQSYHDQALDFKQMNEPQKWPVTDVSSITSIPHDDEYLEGIGDPFEADSPLKSIIANVREGHLTFVVEGTEQKTSRWWSVHSQVCPQPSVTFITF